MNKWKVKKQEEVKKEEEVEKMSDPQTEELTKEEKPQEPQISAYEIELRKACGAFLAQLNQISCLLAVPLPSVLEDADNYLTMIQKEPEVEKTEKK